MLRSYTIHRTIFERNTLKKAKDTQKTRYENTDVLVELIGIEPTTLSLRTIRSTN